MGEGETSRRETNGRRVVSAFLGSTDRLIEIRQTKMLPSVLPWVLAKKRIRRKRDRTKDHCRTHRTEKNANKGLKDRHGPI